MFDIATEQPIRLDEAARIAGTGRGGRPTHVSTVFRWVLKGVPGPDGQRVRLEAGKLGGHWVTSREALQRFVVGLTPRFDNQQASSVRTATQRRRASERAARKLDEIGI